MIQLHGRKLITTTYSPINETNILNVLQEAMSIFCVNQGQIKYLFNYYKGIQPILERTKQYHEEINNKIVENHAREIVAFKVVIYFGNRLNMLVARKMMKTTQ